MTKKVILTVGTEVIGYDHELWAFYLHKEFGNAAEITDLDRLEHHIKIACTDIGISRDKIQIWELRE